MPSTRPRWPSRRRSTIRSPRATCRRARRPCVVADIDRWCEALIARHTASLSRPEFLKAVRALSARYVEARGRLADRSPIDSAGKRAAFAAFYAPLHFVTMREVVRAL